MRSTRIYFELAEVSVQTVVVRLLDRQVDVDGQVVESTVPVRVDSRVGKRRNEVRGGRLECEVAVLRRRVDARVAEAVRAFIERQLDAVWSVHTGHVNPPPVQRHGDRIRSWIEMGLRGIPGGQSV